MAFYHRAGGIVTPLLTAVIAFLMGGIVVLSTGHNPWRTYKAIFEGSGLNWLFHFGNYSIQRPVHRLRTCGSGGTRTRITPPPTT